MQLTQKKSLRFGICALYFKSTGLASLFDGVLILLPITVLGFRSPERLVTLQSISEAARQGVLHSCPPKQMI